MSKFMRRRTTNYLAGLLAFVLAGAVVANSAQALVVCIDNGHKAVELAGHSHGPVSTGASTAVDTIAPSSDCSDSLLEADEIILSRQDLTVPTSFLLPSSIIFLQPDFSPLAFKQSQSRFGQALWLPIFQQRILRTSVLTI